jgi:hypothetical protein
MVDGAGMSSDKANQPRTVDAVNDHFEALRDALAQVQGVK